MYFFIIEKTNFVENWCFKDEIWEIKREIWEPKNLHLHRDCWRNLHTCMEEVACMDAKGGLTQLQAGMY